MNSLWKWVLGASLMLMAAQSAWSACTGTLHFKKPDDWPTQFYVAMNNITALVRATNYNAATGYYDYDLTLAAPENQETSFALQTTTTTSAAAPMHYILGAQWDGTAAYDPNVAKNGRDILCPSMKSSTEVWVMENPKKPGTTLVQYTKPNIKYFYVLVPDEEEWKGTVPMYSPDGTFASRKEMRADPNMCGWYYVVWLDETLPDNFIILRDDDPDLEEAIGLDGAGAETLTPFPMSTFFEAFPDDDKIYFVANFDDLDDPSTKGIFTTDPGIEGSCSYKLAAILYDTDASMHGAFTCDAYPNIASNKCYSATAKYNYAGNGQDNTVPCIGVTKGIVSSVLDSVTKKPTYNPASGCFVSQEAFDVMFKETPGVNFQHCRDVNFKLAKDGLWEYDSYNEPTGAFTILNDLKDSTACTGDCRTAATLREGLGNVRYGVGEQGQTATQNGISTKAQTTLGPVSDWSAIDPVSGLPYIDLYPVSDGEFGDGKNPNVYDNTTWDARIKGLNNQMFCFESHAKFTYRNGMQFSFRGDDDIWVFIDYKLAVDLGGTHLAAPGYVKLDTLNGVHGKLQVGQTYSIDIFFCDRRTDMSNVRIKTNMYIKQSTGIELETTKNSDGGLQLGICVLKTGAGDCASVALGAAGNGQEVTTECGDQISSQVNYSLVTSKGLNPTNCNDCAALPLGVVSHNGIDLRNPRAPVVYPDKMQGLPPGAYLLLIEVDGKKTRYKFRVKGNLGIVNRDVTFENVDQEIGLAYESGTQWKFVDKALAGTRVPIYISAPAEDGSVDIISAVGQTYTLNISGGANIYKTKDAPASDIVPVPYTGRVNETGIDTFWVDVPLAGLTAASQQITASVGNTSAVLTFYAPQLTFANPGDKDADGNVIKWNPADKDPDVDDDGEEYFHWVSADVDFYIIVIDPSTGAICKECNFPIDFKDHSPGLIGAGENGYPIVGYNEGVYLVRIRSNIEYSTEAATMSIASTQNPGIVAAYGNMHFYKPPAPMPLIVDMFDVKGAPLGEMNIPGDYYNEGADYLDGKADSMAVIYDRAIDKDSIPTYLCLKFDKAHLHKINPFDMGISNNPRDTEMECSTEFDSTTIRKAYTNSPDNGQTLVFAIDSTFTSDVKTYVDLDDKVYSFTVYKWKGKDAKTFFEKGLTDRMAPIIMSARASTETDGGLYDQLKVVVSEPVMVTDASKGKEAFTYYLNSAIDFPEAQRYWHSTALAVPPSGKSEFVVRYYNADANNPTPHVGDYIRFRSDTFMWSDTSNGFAPGADTLRQAADADMHWNSPTNHDATTRLPSPWVQVVGDAKIDVTTISYNTVDPSSVNDSTPVGTIFPVKTNENIEDIKRDHPGTLGHFVQSDMGSIIGSDTAYANLDKGEVFFYYEVDYFTNLGAFVARQSGKIACNDPFFSSDPATTAAGMGDCVKNPRNFYIAWNMIAENHRVVGTGAYITKYTSYVKLGNLGKKAKKEKTEVWGVKRGKGVVK